MGRNQNTFVAELQKEQVCLDKRARFKNFKFPPPFISFFKVKMK